MNNHKKSTHNSYSPPSSPPHMLWVVMGVSGCGKSAVARRLSAQLDIPYLDGDYLHPRENVDKMAAGCSLNDDDRQPWLAALNTAGYSMLRTNSASLMICSALKKQYRDTLRAGNPGIRFLFLDGRFDVIESRLKQRQGHYFNAALLTSQFNTLQYPQSDEADVIVIDIEQPLDDVIKACVQQII